ncbi:MAG: flagellar hook-basal body protein [Firmicutes bacterium]|nr:flagellar hook-basal body protein [Bacillota bacterium]
MLEGMKMATQGMLAMMAKQDVVANNLANVGTTGYRKDTLLVSSFNDVLNKEMGFTGTDTQGGYMPVGGGIESSGGLFTQTATHYAQGSLKATDNNFDLALDDNGKGFFTIQSPDGIKFTRNGAFRLSTTGYLITADGSFVLGQKGPIKVKGTDFKVNNDGEVIVGDKGIDKLLITSFADTRVLQKVGAANFVASSGGAVSGDCKIQQGYLEMANVNAVKEMVDMMTIMRAYEANQKILQTQDQMLGKSTNEVGRVK